MVFTGGALLAGSLISGGLSYLAADRAADAQRDASGAAIAEQRRQFDIIRADTAPYRNIGSQALGALGSIYGYQPSYNSTPGTPENPAAGPIMGGGPVTNALRQITPRGVLQNGRTINGDTLGQGPIDAGSRVFPYDPSAGPTMSGQTANKLGQAGGDFFPGGKPGSSPADPAFTNGLNVPDYSRFFASPDYQFRRDEGMRGIENSFAARGGAASGNALRALNEYNSNLAAGEFGNYFNRQASLAGIGQTATNTSANAGIATGQNVGNALINSGNARASGIMNGLGGINNAIQGGIQNYMLWRMLGG